MYGELPLHFLDEAELIAVDTLIVGISFSHDLGLFGLIEVVLLICLQYVTA